MSRPKVKLPWISVDEDLPHDGSGEEDREEVLWMDVDGSKHLARWNGKNVLPAVYGNSDEVEMHISGFVCWMRIQEPEVA